MTGINNIGGEAAEAGDVISVEGRTGEVILDDIYTKFGHLHLPAEIISSLGYTPEDQANKAVANGYASLGADGKIPDSQVPRIAISSTFVVASEVAQLALTVEEGDVAVRMDENKSYIALNSDNNSLSDWQELLAPAAAGVVWGNTRVSGTGFGLTHTIGANAAVGTSSFKTILDNIQNNDLTAHEIDLGTSARAHIGLKILARGAHTGQRAVTVDMGATGTGFASSVTGGGAFTGFRAVGSGNFKGFKAEGFPGGNSTVGFEYETTAISPRGVAFKVNAAGSNIRDLQAFVGNFQSASTTQARINDLFELSSIRNVTGGAFSDNYNLATFSRTLSSAGAGITSDGAVVRMSNTVTPAIDCNTDVLKLTQDADSNAPALNITQGAVFDTNFQKVIDLAGKRLWLSDGTNPDTNLTGVIGDKCMNGPGGQDYFCQGGTDWNSALAVDGLGNLFMKQSGRIAYTSDGTPSGTLRGDFYVNANDTATIRSGPSAFVIFEADISFGVRVLSTLQATLLTSAAFRTLGGAAIAKNLIVGGNTFLNTVKAGATQGGAGAAINEVWKTLSHATLPDNVMMIGV